jgi:hypothetical protein
MLLASMATSAWASCLAEIGMSPAAQMLCCKGGHDKCPMHNTAADCCKAQGQRHPDVSVATHEGSAGVMNPPAVVATFVVPAVPPIHQLSQSTFDRDVLKGPDPPPYLLGSAFRV